MPTYEYECEKCGPFEAKQSMTDEPLRKCPSCGGSVRRLLSASVGISVKGGTSRQSAACDRSSPCCGLDSFCGKPSCDA